MAGLVALIPLDGTHLAESAFSLLPLLKSLGFDRVRLVSAWEESWPQGEEVPEHKAGALEEAGERARAVMEAYLDKQAREVQTIGLEVATDARRGRPAEQILAAAADGVDLIVMATHGREGIVRWRLGSVADRVIRDAPCPALVIGPNVNIELAAYKVARILVPVDGSDLSERMLPLAGWIAGVTGADIDLVRIISPTPIAMDQTMGIYSADLLTAIEDAGRAYLTRLAGTLAPREVRTALMVGSAGELLLNYLKENPASLVIMGTHGRTGVARAALGSVADRLLHGPAPVLVSHHGPEVKSRLFEQAAGGRAT